MHPVSAPGEADRSSWTLCCVGGRGWWRGLPPPRAGPADASSAGNRRFMTSSDGRHDPGRFPPPSRRDSSGTDGGSVRSGGRPLPRHGQSTRVRRVCADRATDQACTAELDTAQRDPESVGDFGVGVARRREAQRRSTVPRPTAAALRHLVQSLRRRLGSRRPPRPAHPGRAEAVTRRSTSPNPGGGSR